MRIWDLTTQRVVQSLDTKRDTLHALAWRADGRVLFLGASGLDATSEPLLRRSSSVIAWDIETEAEIGEVPSRGFATPVDAIITSNRGYQDLLWGE